MTETAFVQQLRHKLQAAFTPSRLEILDDSARHHGHAGARPGGNSHFKLWIVSNSFAGLGRLARHRLIYDVLAEELRVQIHALTIKAETEAEAIQGIQ